MNPFLPMGTVDHNGGMFVYNRREREREETVTLRLEGDMQREVWYWRQAVSNPPAVCFWRVWQSSSSLTEPFRLDRNIVSWCFNTENESQMKWEAEGTKLLRMTNVHYWLDMWQSRRNLRATENESHTQYTQIIAVEYISGTEEIITASWSLFNMMVHLHLTCRKHHLCQQLCLQRTSLEDKLKNWMSAESVESTDTQSRVMSIAHLKACLTAKFG